MIQTAEQIIENVRTLPKIERRKFFELIEVEKHKEERQNDDLKQKNEKFRLALQWIEENKEEYDGQFVVLDGNELIAVGTDSKTVYAEARAKGYTSPFLKRIKAKTLPFGGW
jgi:SAM-dependent MidA family methyltransferase